MLRPKGVDLHYEAELALIMGREVRDLRADDEEGALNAIECAPFRIQVSEGLGSADKR